MTQEIWRQSTDRIWPDMNLGVIRGAAALSFEKDTSKDSERLKILISMTIWAIWKSKLKICIKDKDVTPNETAQLLRELITELITKSWNATRFLEEGRKVTRQRAIRRLWADDQLTKFNPITGPQASQLHLKGCGWDHQRRGVFSG